MSSHRQKGNATMAMTYEGVLRKLGRRISVQLDKVRGTELRRAPGEAGERGDLQVRYHGNAIVTLHTDKTYTLRTYGKPQRIYLTRISEYAPVSLIRRGRSIYLQEPNSKALIPFLDGMRVDTTGHLVGEWAKHAEQAIIAGSEGKATTTTVLDEARLRAYVRRLIHEEIAAIRKLPAGELMDRVTDATMAPATTKATLSATATALTARAIADEPDYVRSLMLQAGANPQKIDRVLKDVRNSVYRGRPPKSDADDLADAAPPTVAPAIGSVGDCGECGLSLIAHYDRANRFRGCQYAADHCEDLTLI
jgi:hypothetical protein